MPDPRPPLHARWMKGIGAWMHRRLDQLETWLRRSELRKGTRANAHGISVVIYRTNADQTRISMEKVHAALELIARHDPRSLEGMRSHFDTILVWYGLDAANAGYLHSERLCMLSFRYVEKESTEPARLAMTLVHELTHARHFSRGRPLRGAHAEWLCIGAELAFIKKVPGTEHLRVAAARRLERRPDFYSAAADTERQLADLEAGGARWSAALLRYLQRRQARAGRGR